MISGEFIYEVTFHEHYPIVLDETEMFSFFRYPISDRYNDFQYELYGNYLTKLYEKKRQCCRYLRIIFLIETMISI